MKKIIGILGGGQLGKMMAYRANLLGFDVNIYSDTKNACGLAFANNYTIDSYANTEAIVNFAKQCNFLTTEFEHISPEALYKSGCENYLAIFFSQNRIREKTLAKNLAIKTAVFEAIFEKQQIINFFNSNGKCVVKTTTLGYDGKGQFVIKTLDDIEKIPANLYAKNTPQTFDEKFAKGFANDFSGDNANLIAESFVSYKLEFSVVATRFAGGDVMFFPSSVNTHLNGILHKSVATHSFNQQACVALARQYTKQIAEKINFVGTLAVEFFLTDNGEESGEIIFNEIAPRPHNSGHFTMDFCNICQFESHIRAVAGLPPIIPQLLCDGEMINILGEDIYTQTPAYLTNPLAKLHLYGKQINPTDNLTGRKLGHVNIRHINQQNTSRE